MAPYADINFDPDESYLSSSYNRSPSRRSRKRRSVRRRRKTVTFANVDVVHEIVHLNDLRHMIDINRVWLSEDDYDRIKADITNTVQDMEAGNALNENEQCARGLQGLTSAGREFREEIKSRGLKSVLEEQSLQRYEGIHDPELLADIFFDTTYTFQFDAERIGIEDMMAIRQEEQAWQYMA